MPSGVPLMVGVRTQAHSMAMGCAAPEVGVTAFGDAVGASGISREALHAPKAAANRAVAAAFARRRRFVR